MPRDVFSRVYSAIEALPFFKGKKDGLGNNGIHLLQRVTAALRIMAYETAADSIGEYTCISESSVLVSLKAFCRAVESFFESDYLRAPNATDLHRILRINACRGFPRMPGSIDLLTL